MRPVSVAARVLFCVLPLLALSGCSKIRFAYNQLDWFLKKQADSYLSFDKAQEKTFETDLKEYLRWHRREMLPKYAAHLRKSADFFASEPYPKSGFENLAKGFEGLVRETALPALPMLSRAMKRMSPKQAARFRKKLESADRDALKRVSGGPEERAEKMTSGISRMFTLFLVRLSYDQKQFMTKYLKENAGSPSPWLEDRKSRRQEVLKLLGTGATEAQLTAYLRGIVMEPEKTRTAEYQKHFERFQNKMQTLFYELVSMMSDKQRAAFVARLREHADTFETLSIEGTPQLKPATNA